MYKVKLLFRTVVEMSSHVSKHVHHFVLISYLLSRLSPALGYSNWEKFTNSLSNQLLSTI